MDSRRPRWRAGLFFTPILSYHRVGEFKGDHVPTVSASAFERQLEFLARRRLGVMGFDDLVWRLANGEPMPRRSVVITFDDGYEETHRVAWPLLRRLGYPATVFVTPAEVGLPGFARWEQLAEMAQDGFLIGSHTMHHSYLPLLSQDELSRELAGSKQAIEERIGQTVQFLSYPIGGFTAQTQAAAEAAGYLAACTTNRAWPDRRIDRFALRRVKVTERDRHPLLFWAKVSGYYDAFRRLEDPC